MNEFIESFKALSKNAKKIIKVVEKYEKLTENPVDNVYILDKILAEISSVAENLPDFELKESLRTWVQAKKNELKKAKEDFRFRFGRELKELLEGDGRQMSGQYPLLRIGLFTLILNFEFCEATLYFGPEIEKLRSKIPLEPRTIAEIIKKTDATLKAIKSTPEEIFKDLYDAYDRGLRLARKSFGEKLLITEVLHQFVILNQTRQFFIDPQRKNFREFSRVMLSYMLYLLKKAHFSERGMKLYIATFDATVDKRNAIWIPENEAGEGTYYSHISFEKV
jgi:hypothetical protein